MLQKIKKYRITIALIGVGVLNIGIAIITPGSRLDWLSYLAAGFSFGGAMWHGFYKRATGWRDAAIERRDETIHNQRITINELRNRQWKDQ